MLLKCLNDYQFERYGRTWKCEETRFSGDLYQVEVDLGKELLVTGDFADALLGVAPDKLEAAQAELSKSYRIVSITSPVGDEPDKLVPTPRSATRGSKSAKTAGEE